MKNLVLFLGLSLVLCFIQNTQAIPQQYSGKWYKKKLEKKTRYIDAVFFVQTLLEK